MIGDSVSAGMLGPEDRTWPRQFEDEYDVAVVDLSQEGETARSALKKIPNLDQERAIVLIEIGGNDLLGLNTSVTEFARALDQLLAGLTGPQRELFLMELPLPPFYNEYGRTQRRLAAKYGVKLIPKRRFASVFAGRNATLDGLHLSETGHRNMATLIWSCLGDAFDEPYE